MMPFRQKKLENFPSETPESRPPTQQEKGRRSCHFDRFAYCTLGQNISQTNLFIALGIFRMQGYGDARYPTFTFSPFWLLVEQAPFSSGLMAFGGSGAEVQLAALCCRAREKARRGQFPSFLPISEPAGEATSDPGVSRMHSSARLKISTLLESYHTWCFLTRRASRRPPKLDLDFLALIAIVNPSANVVF